MKDSLNDAAHDGRSISFRPQRLFTLIVMTVLLLTRFQAHAQNPYAIHANIVYHFTKYINWPSDKKSGDFVIGVVGDSPMYYELKSFTSNKTAGGQRIVVKRMSSSATSFNCHILFISVDESKALKRISAITANTPVLLVTESDGMARKGACINFIIVDERLKLEINKGNIERHNLNIASELLNLGILVK